MADSLKFVLELVDKASGPAKAAAKQLQTVKTQVGGLGKALQPAQSILAKTGSAFTSMAAVAVKSYLAISAAAVGAGVAVGTWGLKQIAQQQDQDLALRTVLKDTQQLDAAMKAVRGIANIFGTDPKTIEAQITKLIMKGHDLNSAMKIVEGANDLKVLGSSVDAVIDAFTALDDKGKVTEKTIAALAGAGLDPGKLRAILGSAIGSSGDLSADIAEGIKKGTVDAATLQAAALKTITEMTGKNLGDLAAERSQKTIGGLWDRLMTLPDRLFDQMDLSKIIEPAMQAMDSFIAVLSGPAGQAAMQSLVDGFSKLVGYVAQFATPENIEGLVTAMTALGSVIGTVVDSWMLLSGVIQEAMQSDLGKQTIDDVKSAFEHLWKLLDSVPWKAILGPLVEGILLVVDAAAVLIDIMGYMIEGLVGAFSWVWEQVKEIFDPASWARVWDGVVDTVKDVIGWFERLPETFSAIGTAIISALTASLRDGAKIPAQTMQDVGKGLADATKEALKIHSPSRVMMDIGMMTTSGFNIGLEKGGAQTPSIFADIVHPGDMTTTIGGASQTSVEQHNKIDININGDASGSQRDLAKQIAGDVRGHIIAFMNDLVPA